MWKDSSGTTQFQHWKQALFKLMLTLPKDKEREN